MIEWTDEAKRRVHPRTAAEVHESRPRSADALWKALKKSWRPNHVASYRLGLETTAADVAPSVERALAALEASQLPPDDLPLDVLTVLWPLLGGYGVSTFAQFLHDHYGLPRAIEAWVASAWIELLTPSYQNKSQKGYTLKRCAEPRAPNAETHFRHALLVATPEERAEARVHGERLFTAGSLTVRACAVLRFPFERAWAEELAREYLATPPGPRGHVSWFVTEAISAAVEDVALAREVALRMGPGEGNLESMLRGCGEPFVPTILELAGRVVKAHEIDRMARVLATIRAPEVAAFFAKHLAKKNARKRAMDYFPRFPELAGDALAPLAKKKTRVALIAAELIARCERLVTGIGDVEEASPEELPEILVRAPWAGAGRPKRKRVVIDDAAALDGPRALHQEFRAVKYASAPTDMTAPQLAVWRGLVDAHLEGRPGTNVNLYVNENARVPPAARLEVWNRGGWKLTAHVAAGMLGEFGLDALPGLVRWALAIFPTASNAWWVRPIDAVEAPELAPAFAELLPRSQQVRDVARSWLRRFPEAAIAGLVPAALGAEGPRRNACENALRWLAGQDRAARIRERAAELGRAATRGIEEILAWDPIYDCPKKPPKLPPSYRPEALERPKLKNGKALPIEALQRIGEMLAFSRPDDPYVGLALVREACDERSLAELSWDLAAQWEHTGSNRNHAWMCYSLVHFADDEVVRRTTPALKNGLIVDVLVYIGSEAAAMELATVASRGAKSTSYYSSSRMAAEQALDRIAAAEDITRDELDDRLTPTCGLDERGGLDLDLGARTFRVGFDAHLAPEIIDAEGTRKKALPRGSKKDDPEKVARAKLLWNEILEDVGAIAWIRIDALERAMLGERTWPTDAFLRNWVHHRLMMHLARRVVWAAHGPGDRVTTFRVTEEGALADAAEETFTLDGVDRISIPHPHRWPDTTLDAWRRIFTDYELGQPFAQLHRPEPKVSDAERATLVVGRVRRGYQDMEGLRRWAIASGFVVGGRYERSIADDQAVRVTINHSREGGELGSVSVQLHHMKNNQPSPWTDAPSGLLEELLDRFGVPEVS